MICELYLDEVVKNNFFHHSAKGFYPITSQDKIYLQIIFISLLAHLS